MEGNTHLIEVGENEYIAESQKVSHFSENSRFRNLLAQVGEDIFA